MDSKAKKVEDMTVKELLELLNKAKEVKELLELLNKAKEAADLLRDKLPGVPAPVYVPYPLYWPPVSQPYHTWTVTDTDGTTAATTWTLGSK